MQSIGRNQLTFRSPAVQPSALYCLRPPTLSLASHSLPLQCTRLHCPGSLSLPVSSFSDYLPLLSNVLYLPSPPVIRVYPLPLSSDSISIPQPPVSRISLLPLASRISHLPLPPWFRVSLHSLTLSCPAAATLAAAITLISHVNYTVCPCSPKERFRLRSLNRAASRFNPLYSIA